MNGNPYMHDEELRGWLLAWSFLIYIGGFVSGVVFIFFAG